MTKPDPVRHLTISKAVLTSVSSGEALKLYLFSRKKIHSPKRKINRKKKDNMLWLGVETALQVCLFRIALPSALETLRPDTSLSRETKWHAQPTEECPVPEWSLLLPVH